MNRLREFALTSKWAPWLLALAIAGVLAGALIALEALGVVRVFGN